MQQVITCLKRKIVTTMHSTLFSDFYAGKDELNNIFNPFGKMVGKLHRKNLIVVTRPLIAYERSDKIISVQHSTVF